MLKDFDKAILVAALAQLLMLIIAYVIGSDIFYPFLAMFGCQLVLLIMDVRRKRLTVYERRNVYEDLIVMVVCTVAVIVALVWIVYLYIPRTM